MAMNEQTRAKLKTASTATLCTSLYKRGLKNQFADEAVEMTAFEDFVMEEVSKGRGIIGLYSATDEQTRVDIAAWRQAKRR